MGPRLFPAKQARNIIERMVRTGAISGPKADAWSKKLAEEEEVKAMRARAEGGDGDAMLALAKWYLRAEKGLTKDDKQAAGWYQRGHDVGNATCTGALGVRYAKGLGVREDWAYALCLYGIAAARGSELACFNLANCLFRGYHEIGLQPNVREATHWFRAMGSATVRDAGVIARKKAAKWLREHAVDS